MYAKEVSLALEQMPGGQTVAYILDIIPYRRQRKLRAISLLNWIPVFTSDRTCTAVRTSQAVQAHHEEARTVECSARPTYQRTPPIANISAPGQGVADDHGIVPVRRQLALCAICNGYIVQRDA